MDRDDLDINDMITQDQAQQLYGSFPREGFSCNFYDAT